VKPPKLFGHVQLHVLLFLAHGYWINGQITSQTRPLANCRVRANVDSPSSLLKSWVHFKGSEFEINLCSRDSSIKLLIHSFQSLFSGRNLSIFLKEFLEAWTDLQKSKENGVNGLVMWFELCYSWDLRFGIRWKDSRVLFSEIVLIIRN